MTAELPIPAVGGITVSGALPGCAHPVWKERRKPCSFGAEEMPAATSLWRWRGTSQSGSATAKAGSGVLTVPSSGEEKLRLASPVYEVR